MSELKVDIDGINKKVIPPLKKAITELELAANRLNEISYSPEEYKFDKRNRVQNVLPQNIRKIKNNISSVKKWLENTSDKFNQAEKNSTKAIESLQLPTENIVGINNKTSNKSENKSQKNNSSKRIYGPPAPVGRSPYVPDLRNFDSVNPINPIIPGAQTFFTTDIKSLFWNKYNGDLKYTKAEVDTESTKLKDSKEVKKGLENLNNILDIQKKSLEDDAEDLKNKITSNTDPTLTRILKSNFKNRDADNIEDIEQIISVLQISLSDLEANIPDSKNSNSEYYSSDTIVKSAYEDLYIAQIVKDEDEWKSIQEYLKKNNFTWKDVKNQYKEKIKELEKYKEELLNKKNQIYQIERYIDLYPYTTITQKKDFKKYLKRDYSGVDTKFNELTLEEKAIYFYIKEKYSEGEADEYYSSLEDTINQRKGMKDALEYVKNLDPEKGIEDFIKTTGMGLKDGVWSFGEGIYNLFPGNGEIMSELQYKQAFLMSMMTQKIDLKEIEKNYGKNSKEYKLYEKLYKMQDEYKKALGGTYNVASAIGSEAIPIAISLIPEIGQPLGIALSSLSDAGNAKATAYQNGVKGWNAYLYAGIRGISSAVITKSFGAIPGLSDNASTTLKGIVKGSVQARTFCCCSTKNRFIYS